MRNSFQNKPDPTKNNIQEVRNMCFDLTCRRRPQNTYNRFPTESNAVTTFSTKRMETFPHTTFLFYTYHAHNGYNVLPISCLTQSFGKWVFPIFTTFHLQPFSTFNPAQCQNIMIILHPAFRLHHTTCQMKFNVLYTLASVFMLV